MAEPNLEGAFRRLYYDLYSNSEASRAERIVADLSLLLLVKFAAEVREDDSVLAAYFGSGPAANEILIPFLRETYPDLITPDERFSLGDRAIRSALRELAAVSISGTPAHVLGDAFQALMGPRLRGDKGQFFTPRSLVRAMVEVVSPQPHESVLDPAAGTGGFLAEAHAYQAGLAGDPDGRLLTGRLAGVDKDHDLHRLSTALLEICTRGRARLASFNSLDVASWTIAGDSGSGPGSGDSGGSVGGGFDAVLTNPPFGARIGVRDAEILKQFALGHVWAHGAGGWTETAALLPDQDPQVLFLELCVRKLRPGGRLGIVLPEGLFGNRQTSYVWDWLDTQGAVTALLDCPRTTFQPGTDTKTNVLFFRKSPTREGSSRGKVSVAVALHCGHDRRGRTYRNGGQSYPDDFGPIARDFHASGGPGGRWREVDLGGSSYLVPRYYEEQKPLTRHEEELTRGAEYPTVQELLDRGWLTLRKGHEPGSDAYGTGDVPFVRTSDLNNLEISTDPTKSVSEEVYQRFAPHQRLEPGDVLMAVDGRYRIGATAMLTENNSRCVVQSHLRIIGTPNREELDPYALLYALNLPSVKRRLRDLVFVQSTLGTLGKRLLELRIPVLHAAGPWAGAVARFRRNLQLRDRLLTELRAATSPELDL